ncbi:DNA polymerase III, alpha subunit [Candidatus Phytoplasma mali]|uniref:DNA polymerase III PolC-type n=1 Tax=Phytoplasma mali (strain AT) TaxID=482235 RepID=B3R0M5_PHYMT|nr:PolC-type DNA polymerase III [Candidatus Phytoplasma mali]CAP18609.1 DNA polymerase III, alpha subunit [Candidatus Phytoplasma mali]
MSKIIKQIIKNHELFYENNQLIKIFHRDFILEITKKEFILIIKNQTKFQNFKFQKTNFQLKEINYQNLDYQKLIIKPNKINPHLIQNLKLDQKIIYKNNQIIKKIRTKIENNTKNYYFLDSNLIYCQELDLTHQGYKNIYHYIYAQKNKGDLLLKIVNQTIPKLKPQYQTLYQTYQTIKPQIKLQVDNFTIIPHSKVQYLALINQNYGFKNKTLTLKGYIQEIQFKPSYLDNEKLVLEFILAKKTFDLSSDDAILVKKFDFNIDEKQKWQNAEIQNDDYLEITGTIYQPKINDQVYLILKTYQKIILPIKIDKQVGLKRIEFSAHTKMSEFNGLISPETYLTRLNQYQHSSIAFIDLDNVIAFPKIEAVFKNTNIKPIYGLEIYFQSNQKLYLNNPKITQDYDLNLATYVIFDFETTGLSKINDQIIEIAAIKIQNNQIIDEFQTLINPQQELTPFIENLTNISNQDLKNQPLIATILPKFLKFCENSILIAHNISFDMGFLVNQTKKHLNLKLNLPFIDTLNLARYCLDSNLRYFNLKSLAKYFKISFENHHRAMSDVLITKTIFQQLLNYLLTKNIQFYQQLKLTLPVKFIKPFRITLLVKNQIGLTTLYQLLSKAQITNFNSTTKLTFMDLINHRSNLLIGNTINDGDLMEIALNENDFDLENAINFYDYITIQPITCYQHLMLNLGTNGSKIIQNAIKRIIKFAKKAKKLIIATGNVFYLDHEQKKYYAIYTKTALIAKKLHPLVKCEFEDLPNNAFLTTTEMLKMFEFLNDSKLIEEIVIINPNLLNTKIASINILPQKLLTLADNELATSPLKINSINQTLKQIILTKMITKYGENWSLELKQRFYQEFQIIINHQSPNYENITVMYLLAYLLVQKSLQDGYLVGSRGSIGSSFIAYLIGITEVNPLKPHYYCQNCLQTWFNVSELESTIECPRCDLLLFKTGNNIPFEAFLGLNGNKTPDIDLNFASKYQEKAQNYLQFILGIKQVFKVSTIQTISNKTAFSYVYNYLKTQQIKARFHQINLISKQLIGTKRTIGTHSSGLIIVPKNNSIYQIAPFQNSIHNSKIWQTISFEYHSFENNLSKLDILSHENPTLFKMFFDYIKQHPKKFPFKNYHEIPINDSKVFQLFTQTFKNSQGITISTLGIPEFGTKFVRKMLVNIYQVENQPFNLEKLIKVSGLSHGTNVWLNNGLDIINQTNEFQNLPVKITFKDIIACREDIYNYLIINQVPKIKAFEIMEFVRKGKQHQNLTEWQTLIKPYQNLIPTWYWKSAFKIKYLFPKAHASAYTLMAIKIAYFKVYYPILFYYGYFSQKITQFNYQLIIGSIKNLEQEIKTLNQIKQRKLTNLENESLITYELVLEFKQQNFKLQPINWNYSAINEFLIINETTLLIPLTALNSLGIEKANLIIQQRQQKLFTDKTDFIKRTKISKTLISQLETLNGFIF